MSVEERRSVKMEEWEPIAGAAFDADVEEIGGIETLPIDNTMNFSTLDANSEDSTCEQVPGERPTGTNPQGPPPDTVVKAEPAPEGDGSDCGDGAVQQEADTPCSATTPGSPAQATAKTRTSRRRTSKYCGVCSANRKNQWQARILMHGKVTHLGYFDSEEEAARVYDVVSLSLHREKANTNFPVGDYTTGKYAQKASKLCGLSREELQRSLGVKPIRKTSRFNGVSKKRGKWVAKVMIDKKLVYHASFEDEREAAHAYDAAVRRLKPNKAHAYVNFREPVQVKPALNVNAVPAPNGMPGQVGERQQMMGMPTLAVPDVRSQWNPHSLQGRMPFHHMQSSDPTMLGTVPGMISHPQSMAGTTQPHMGMYGHREVMEQGVPASHSQGMSQSSHPAFLKHNAMSGGSQPTVSSFVDSQQLWGVDNGSREPSQWPWPATHRVGGMHPGYSSSLTHMPRPMKDESRSHGLPQMPQAPWDHSMKQMPFQSNPMDSHPRSDMLRSHVQHHLMQPSAMGMMPDRQISGASTWTNPYNSGLQSEMDTINNPHARNFPMLSHQWS